MFKVILIVMLMNAETGEVSNVQRPEGYQTIEACNIDADQRSSTKDGWVVRAYCLKPSDMQPAPPKGERL